MMIGDAREQMMQGVVAQAHRGPERNEDRRPGVIQRVQELAGRAHRFAQGPVMMGGQQAQAVHEQDEGYDEVQLQHQRHRDDAAEEAGRDQDQIKESGQFLPPPLGGLLIRRKIAHVGQVDHQGRGPGVGPLPQGPAEPAQRREDEEPHDEELGRHEAEPGKDQNPHPGSGSPAAIFSVPCRAVTAEMVIVVARVDKTRNQQRNAAEQIPDEAKDRHLSRRQMGQLVDEDDGAVEGEARHHQDEVFGGLAPGKQGRGDEAKVEQGRRAKKIEPIDAGPGGEEFVEFAAQPGDRNR